MMISLLRPISLLPRSARLWSRYMLGVLAKYDTPGDRSHLGFEKGRSCAEIA